MSTKRNKRRRKEKAPREKHEDEVIGSIKSTRGNGTIALREFKPPGKKVFTSRAIRPKNWGD